MSRYRALMTETDREYITGEGDPSQDQKDQSVYRVRQRIREELPRDIDVLAEHRPDVLDELRKVILEDYRPILCPVCGEMFDQPSNAVNHLIGPTTHDMTPEEAREIVPRWWGEEQEDVLEYVGIEEEI